MLRKSIFKKDFIIFLRNIFFLLLISLLCGCGRELPELFSSMKASITIKDNSNYDFGLVVVGTYKEAEFILVNVGLGKATEIDGSFYFNNNFMFKGGVFPGDGGTCSDVLEPQEECKIVVRFEPKYSGKMEAVATISYYNGIEYSLLQAPVLKGQGTDEIF